MYRELLLAYAVKIYFGTKKKDNTIYSAVLFIFALDIF